MEGRLGRRRRPVTADADDVRVTVDLLRRRAGDRRSSRFWDRGQWFCALVVAVLSFGIGVWSVSATLFGEVVDSTVQSCETELDLSGR
jgi:hypothetical protein